jgi:hypothetical protein
MSLIISEIVSNRNFSGGLASKRAIILLGMDWHSLANRALLLRLEAAEARFWVRPRRVTCLGGIEVVRRMASRKNLMRIP